MAKLTFEPPTIIGALCTKESEIPPELKHLLGRLKPRFAFLPFKVEKRYLANTIACMRLMDIKSIVVLGKLREAIAPILKRANKTVMRSKRCDVIIRKKGRFYGIDVMDTLYKGKAPKRGRSMGLFYHTIAGLLTA